MGCLVELFMEIVFEVAVELVISCYMALMMLILPNKSISPKAEKTIRVIVISFSAVLFIVLLCGTIFFIQDNNLILRKVGKYMTFISLSIIVVQVVSGIVFKIVKIFRRKSQ